MTGAFDRGSWTMSYDEETKMVTLWGDGGAVPPVPAHVFTEKEMYEHDIWLINMTRHAVVKRINGELDNLVKDGHAVSWTWLNGVTRVRELVDPDHPRTDLYEW